MDDVVAHRTIRFVNIAHALDHFVLLIYPTAVIVIASERGAGYADLIGLSTGAFVAFGLFSLPVGWLADRVGRRKLLAVFFFGYAVSCLGLALSPATPAALAGWLLVLGIASSIYHPVGSSMLVTATRRLGRDLGVNGVCGNLGAAAASAVTAAVAAALGWRASFAVPGLACAALGVAFLWLVPAEPRAAPGQAKNAKPAVPVERPLLLAALFGVSILAGGMTFNVTTIAMPKLLDERLGLALPLWMVGSLATVVFAFGAMTQLAVGRLIDRIALGRIFVGLSLFQPLGLAVAAVTTGVPLLAALIAVMAALYGQVVVNDAMVARYVPPDYRAKAFGLRYFLGFTASGLAVPMIAALTARGGFPLVLGTTAAFGAVILAAAIGFWAATRHAGQTAAAPAPAE